MRLRRGVYTQNHMYGTRESQMKAIQVEHKYISNDIVRKKPQSLYRTGLCFVREHFPNMNKIQFLPELGF